MDGPTPGVEPEGGMETRPPEEAAERALATLPPDELDDGAAPPPGEEGRASEPEPEPEHEHEHKSERRIEVELRAVIATFDVVARKVLGDPWALTSSESEELFDAWRDYAIEEGGIPMPTWVPGLLVTASIYGPKFRAARRAREPRDAEAEVV